ncbi:Alpha/Beta hydrolase protein [Corynascus similis CBS 632.67]
MSELQKKWAKAKITTAMHTMAPPPPPLAEFNELDEDRYSAYGSGSVPNTPQDDDSSSASSMSSTGTVIPSPGRALFARPQGFPNRSLDPIPWTAYFERELFLPSPDGSITYHAYLTSPAPPTGPGKGAGPLFVTHHGAGSSGLSFAVLGAEIRKRLPSAGILSLDARGHGSTTTAPATNSATGAAATAATAATATEKDAVVEDLSLSTLASDLLAVLTLTKAAMHWPSLPPVILVGHSLGGAVVTEFASVLLPSLRSVPPSLRPPLFPTTNTTTAPMTTTGPSSNTTTVTSTTNTNSLDLDVLGYAVLDVVEGSAMDALQSMHAYLATRPAGFESLRDAVDWHVRSRTVRNAVSARASVPGLLVPSQKPSQRDGLGIGSDSGLGEEGGGGGGGGVGATPDESEVRASRSSSSGGGTGSAKGNGKPWRWRTDLAKTQPFWEGWFTGLSKKFLGGRGGKMLLLAGTDRLDTELTIGQMQGKYALQVFPEAGHFIHEDLPEKTAIALVDFHRRNDRSALVLPPKVSDLLAQGKKI